MGATDRSYLYHLRLDRGVTVDRAVAAIQRLYGRQFPPRRYVHYESQNDPQVRRTRLGTLTHEQVARAIRWAAGDRDADTPDAPPAAPAAPTLAAAVEAIVLTPEQRDTFIRAWNDHDLSLQDVREMFDLRDSEWRATLRFLGLDEGTRQSQRVAIPPPPPPPAPAPAAQPVPVAARQTPRPANSAFAKSSGERRLYVKRVLADLGLNREAMMLVYDTRTLAEISDHYGLSQADVYIALGLLDIPLRDGRRPAISDPPPWPGRSAAEAFPGLRAAPTPAAPAGVGLGETLAGLRAHEAALRARLALARVEQERLQAEADEVGAGIVAGEIELRAVTEAAAALGALLDAQQPGTKGVA